MSPRYTPSIDGDDEFEVEEEASSEEEEPEEEEQVEIGIPAEVEIRGALSDPWPTLTFLMMVLGFILVIFTPVDLWYSSHWALFGIYIFTILTSGGVLFALQTWKRNPESGMRYGGIFNGITIGICGILGLADALKTVFFGTGLFPDFSTPIYAISSFVIVLCMYSLVLIQRTTKRGY